MSDEMKEAKTFKAWASLEGVPVEIKIRAYVEDDKVLAIRSAIVTDASGEAYPTIHDGKATLATLDVDRQSRMASMLRRLEWAGGELEFEDLIPCCPACHRTKNEGHTPTCYLATLLKELP